MELADFMIHVPADLSTQARAQIETDLVGCDGVVSAHFNKDHPHMLTIAYNPQVIDSDTILRHVGERGLPVSKIGL